MTTLRRSIVLGAGAALLLCSGAFGRSAATAATKPASTSQSAPPTIEGKPSVILTTADNGGTRVYEARVIDGAGRPQANASLDISGLTGNPDDRIATTVMKPLAADPTRYQAKVTFPVSGDWVLTVRVHKPVDFVHLGYERITDSAAPAPTHEQTPSRADLAAITPDFNARYDPVIGIGGDGSYATVAKINAANAGGHGASTDHGTTVLGVYHPTEPIGTRIQEGLLAALHSAGALAWFGGMAGLALANRQRGSRLATELVGFVQEHYTLLVGGGLSVVVLTGMLNMQDSTPTGWNLQALLSTGIGTAYFVVLGLKLAVAAMSIALSIQIGRLLRNPVESPMALSLRSAGAAAVVPARLDRALRLGYLNATFGATALGCVVVLHQLHLAIHG